MTMTNKADKADREEFEAEYILPPWIYYDAKTERYAKPKAYNYDSNHEIVCKCNSHWYIWQAACAHKDKELAELEDRLSLHNDLMGNGQCFTKEGWLAYEHKATTLQADNARLREIFKKLKQ
jgi:hypothetical protein